METIKNQFESLNLSSFHFAGLMIMKLAIRLYN